MYSYIANRDTALAIRNGRKRQFCHPIERDPLTIDGMPYSQESRFLFYERNGSTRVITTKYGFVGYTLVIREPWQIINMTSGEIYGGSWRNISRRHSNLAVVYFSSYNGQISEWRNPTHLPGHLAEMRIRITDLRGKRLSEFTDEDVMGEGFDSREAFIQDWDKKFSAIRLPYWSAYGVAFPSNECTRTYDDRVSVWRDPYVAIYDFELLTPPSLMIDNLI